MCGSLYDKTRTLTSHFSFTVVVVAGRQQVSKDQSRNEHLLCFVLHNRNTLAVVPNPDLVLLAASVQRDKSKGPNGNSTDPQRT